MPYGRPNPMTQLPPQAPSALVKTCRWGFLIAGIVYGSVRLQRLRVQEKKYQEDTRETFAFIKARCKKHEKEHNVLDELNLYNEVKGIPKVRKEFKL